MRIRNWVLGLEAREEDQVVDDSASTEVEATEAPAPDDVDNSSDVAEESDADTAIAEEPEVIEATDAPEADLVPSEGATAEEAEVDRVMDKSERLASDISDLQTISSVVNDSIDDGGAEESARRIVDVAVENFCSRWDIPHTRVATESRYQGSKMIQTRIALEGLGEVIANGIRKLIIWIKEAIKSIGKWFTSQAGTVAYFEKHLAKLRAAEDKFPKGEMAMRHGNWATYLYINGELNPKAVFDYADKMSDHTKMMVMDIMDTIHGQHADMLEKANGSYVSQLKLKWISGSTIKGRVSKIMHDYGLAEADCKGVCVMPGENYLFVFQKDGQPMIRYIKAERLDERAYQGKFKTTTSDLVHAAIAAAEKYIGLFKERTAESSKYVTGLEQLERELETVEKAAKSNTSAEDRTASQTAITRMRQNIANTQSIQRGMIAGLKDACAGCLSYVAAAHASDYVDTKEPASEKQPGTELAVA